MNALPNESTSPVSTICSAIVDNIEKVIVGKRDAAELAVVCFAAGGHLLIEDVPGVGKTSLAKALARSIGGDFSRVQFTPDLLPGDVIGVNVWDRAQSRFSFRPGPVFANVVLADELNRASPKVQSALLEAMAENQVTVDGTAHELDDPFMVIATENPIDHEGTYPLPESQLDRFCMRVAIGYPAADDEAALLDGNGGSARLEDLTSVTCADDVAALRAGVDAVNVAPTLRSYLVSLAQATREHPMIHLGMSPRATIMTQRVARAYAALRGRAFVTPDDIRDVLSAVVAHRFVLTAHARSHDVTASDILSEIVQHVAVPTGAQHF